MTPNTNNRDRFPSLRSSAQQRSLRSGKILVLMAVMLPTLMGILALVIDGGLMMHQYRAMQQASDAAATAAATDLRLGYGSQHAIDTANELVRQSNGHSDASVEVQIPPASGKFANRPNFVEVKTTIQHRSRFARIVDGILTRNVRNRSVAGLDDVTAGAAIVVLDPDPTETSLPSTEEITNEVPSNDVSNQVVSTIDLNGTLSSLGLGALLPGIQSRFTNALVTQVQSTVDSVLAEIDAEVPLPALPGLIAGMEIEGLGRLKVDGAILVNNEWGGKDEHGDIVSNTGFTYGVACMPILPTTRVYARDIRVVGGVDNPDNYRNFVSGKSTPLQANRLPVPDPFESLPVPSVASDANNVNATLHNPADVIVVSLGTSIPQANLVSNIVDQILSPLAPAIRALLQPAITPLVQTIVGSLQTPPALTPGVYNSITVIALGEVTFQPGVYVIRGTSPSTQMALAIMGGQINADGVLFYITNSSNFDPATGSPDAGENASAPPNPLLSVKPSTFIAPLLPGSHIVGLNDPGSPFNGLLVYQHRTDRRPIVIGATKLLGGGGISGTVYSKWGHVIFLGGQGTYDLRFVSGTFRVLTLFDSTIAPTHLLPAAQDVLLAE
jgi:hypothetical protein